MTGKTKHKILGIVFFIVVFILLNLIFKFFNDELIKEEKHRYEYVALNEANFISNSIDKVVVRTYTLKEMIIENKGKTDFFDVVVENVYNSVKQDTNVNLRNFVIAPNGIVSKVYPFATNESLIGFDFTDFSRLGNKEAVEAYMLGKTVVTNPFDLMQGGVGMAARTPVYLKNDGKLEFWGLVSATMDFDDLLHTFNFDTFNQMQIDYILWYEDSDGTRVNLAKTKDSLENAVSVDFNVYNLVWHLDILPSRGWFNPKITIVARIIVLIITSLLTVLLVVLFHIQDNRNRMRELVEQDSLTQCYSRHYLQSEIIDINTGSWKKKNHNYSIALIDVDYFKLVNDKYGHIIGDRVLVAIANVLRKTMQKRGQDCVIRFGGDEFILYFDSIDEESLRKILAKICKKINGITFEDMPELKLGVSIGAALYDGKKSYKEMMQLADQNLYKVKKAGKNNFML